MAFEQGSDKQGHVLPLIMGVAVARNVDTSISGSTEFTLDTSTRLLRCIGIAQDTYLKWGTDDVTASNFDQVIPAGQIVDLPIPNQTDSGDKFTAYNVIERVSGAGFIGIEF